MPKIKKNTAAKQHLTQDESTLQKTDKQTQSAMAPLEQRLELVLQDKDILPADISNSPLFKKRFKRYLPVVIDVETGGVDCTQDALLEVAIVMLNYDQQQHLTLQLSETVHIEPFSGGRLTAEAMAINGIDPDHPFRFALAEEKALAHIFAAIEQGVKNSGCQRAVLVGHNAHFDLNFLQAAIGRSKVSSPLHRFTCYDTATLGGIFYGHTVLAKALAAAKIGFDPKKAHSAIYDAEQTAKLFCKIVNSMHSHIYSDQ